MSIHAKAASAAAGRREWESTRRRVRLDTENDIDVRLVAASAEAKVEWAAAEAAEGIFVAGAVSGGASRSIRRRSALVGGAGGERGATLAMYREEEDFEDDSGDEDDGGLTKGEFQAAVRMAALMVVEAAIIRQATLTLTRSSKGFVAIFSLLGKRRAAALPPCLPAYLPTGG